MGVPPGVDCRPGCADRGPELVGQGLDHGEVSGVLQPASPGHDDGRLVDGGTARCRRRDPVGDGDPPGVVGDHRRHRLFLQRSGRFLRSDGVRLEADEVGSGSQGLPDDDRAPEGGVLH